jgi:hypothetical protein
MQTKVCSKCGKEKPLSEFHKDKQGKFGVRNHCKFCRISPKAQQRLLVPKGFKICSSCHKEKLLSEFHKDVTRNDGLRSNCKKCNLEEVCDYHKSHQQESKQYYLNNREQILKQTTEYKKAHQKERHEYYLKNKDKQREQNKISRKNRIKTDTQFKLSIYLRSAIHRSLKNNTKTGKAIDLMGCSWDFLKQHLESQFNNGMDWKNYGRKGWHIDHIKPISKFDLRLANEQRKCWNYTNLQPLWWYDNLKKSNKYEEK